MTNINFSASEAIRQCKVAIRVTGMKRAKLRLWLGIKLIALGAWITGCDVEINGFSE